MLILLIKLYTISRTQAKCATPQCCYFKTLKGKQTGVEFVDSTSIKVCHNLRTQRHKTWQVIAAKLTTGNVQETKPAADRQTVW